MHGDTVSDEVKAIIEQTRRLPPAQLGAIVACLRDNGAGALAAVLIGRVPFDGEQQALALERLTDE